MAENLFADSPDLKPMFSGNLATKLFYEYTQRTPGEWISGEKDLLTKATEKGNDLYNTIVFVPATNEFVVNGTWYGAGTDFKENLRKMLVNIFGEDLIADDNSYKIADVLFDDNKQLGKYVIAKAIEYANSATENFTIVSDEDDSTVGYIEVTDNKDSIYDDAEAIVNREVKLSIPLDNKTVFSSSKALTSPVDMFIVPAGYTIYNGLQGNTVVGDPGTDKVRIVLFYNVNYAQTPEQGGDSNFKFYVFQNIVSIIDASIFVLDSQIDKVVTDPDNPHGVIISWASNEGIKETKLDFSDIVNFETIASYQEDKQSVAKEYDTTPYLVFEVTHTDTHPDGSDPHATEYTAKLTFETDLNTRIQNLEFKPTETPTDADSYELYSEEERPANNKFDYGLVTNKEIAYQFAKRDKALNANLDELKNGANEAVKDLHDDILGEDGLGTAEGCKLQELREEVAENLKNAVEGLDSEIDFVSSTEWVSGSIKQEDGKLSEASLNFKLVKILGDTDQDTIDVDTVEHGFADAHEVVEIIEKVETALELYIDNRMEQAMANINAWVNQEATDENGNIGAWKKISLSNIENAVRS